MNYLFRTGRAQTGIAGTGTGFIPQPGSGSGGNGGGFGNGGGGFGGISSGGISKALGCLNDKVCRLSSNNFQCMIHMGQQFL